MVVKVLIEVQVQVPDRLHVPVPPRVVGIAGTPGNSPSKDGEHIL